MRNATGTFGKQGNRRALLCAVLNVQICCWRRGWRSVELLRTRVLGCRAVPIGESRRSSFVPCCLDDVCNSLVLQRRRKVVATMLLIQVDTSGGRLESGAIMWTVLCDRLIEQDKVLKRWWLLLCWWLRGECRQARWTGGKPWWLLGIRGEDWEVLAVNGGGGGKRTWARATKLVAEVQIYLWRKSWGGWRRGGNVKLFNVDGYRTGVRKDGGTGAI